jgi:hypothetical protein
VASEVVRAEVISTYATKSVRRSSEEFARRSTCIREKVEAAPDRWNVSVVQLRSVSDDRKRRGGAINIAC